MKGAIRSRERSGELGCAAGVDVLVVDGRGGCDGGRWTGSDFAGLRSDLAGPWNCLCRAELELCTLAGAVPEC